MITQVSSGELNKNRNLMWTKREKACLILIFSTNTNCESMAYRSFRSEEYSARGVRKVTTGIIANRAGEQSKTQRVYPTHASPQQENSQGFLAFSGIKAKVPFVAYDVAFRSIDASSWTGMAPPSLRSVGGASYHTWPRTKTEEHRAEYHSRAVKSGRNIWD